MSINNALSVRSDHSVGESIMQIDTIVERAKELGFVSVALVDTMSVSSLVPFMSKCKKAGIQPILGCTLRVYDDPTYKKPKKGSGEVEKVNHMYQIKVYVKSDKGFRSLLKLLSRGNSSDHFYYHARVGLDDVMALEDVIVTTGDLFNVFHHSDYAAIIGRLETKFHTLIEIVPINSPLFDTLNQRAIDFVELRGGELIASYPFFYSKLEDADTLDVLRAITTNTKMSDFWLPVPHTRDWCFDTPRQLAARMVALKHRISMSETDIRLALLNQSIITTMCSYEFKKLVPSLPIMAADEFVELVKQCGNGWGERFSSPVYGHKPDPAEYPVYKERLRYELGVLKKLGFSNYFLVVQDIVRWSKANEIMVGPGRGSVGGSLIAYLMGITDVDPIRFDLLFERFINEDRIDLPDADLDFMSSRRQDVITYITGRYGSENVAGISNYSTLGPASALRDTARIHDMMPFDYACSKQMEKEHGVSLSLTESAEKVPDIARFQAGHPIIWKHAVKLEGCLKNFGQHAAGIIVAAEPIVNRAVLLNREEGTLPVVNWDKSTVEDFGLIKMDILGLSTLDVLYRARQYIQERHKKTIDYLRIPLDNEEVLRAFGNGETVGVFQFESSGMRKLLRDLAVTHPLTFDDIAATTALYRPGPIDAGLLDRYVAVKQGRAMAEYDHPRVEPALTPTFGVLVFQEQIMQVCRDLAGFTMIEADHVRKAMGKKDRVKMAEYRELFVAGAVKSGMHEHEAGVLWDKIEGFAAYCFNKSHSVEYSVISYLCMWLKVRYPAEFFAAAMTVVDDDTKLTGLVIEARRLGMNILPPDINRSTDRMEIEGENTLFAPFQSVKGLSAKTSSYVLAVRTELGRDFSSKADFEAGVKLAKLGAKVNKNHLECLDRIGAFAAIEPATPAAMSTDRLKARIELMPGLTVDVVKAERALSDDHLNKIKIISLIEEFRGCKGCTLAGTPHPTPTIGTSPKFMMVFDSPNWQEGQQGKILAGDAGAYVRAALKEAGISAQDGYFTALVKAVKPKEAKMLSMEMINGCSGYLAREIEILKPAVIVAMGANAIRYFAPGVKGQPSDLAGKTIYDPTLDASIVFGISPASLHFDASKIKFLQEACAKLADLIT
jgi:DNA polymerase-3 subunit alpha